MMQSGMWLVATVFIAKILCRASHFALRFTASSRGYDDITHKHRKHKRGRPKHA